MSRYISIPADVENYLDSKAKRDEKGRREETHGAQLRRLFKLPQPERGV